VAVKSTKPELLPIHVGCGENASLMLKKTVAQTRASSIPKIEDIDRCES
jgi:hypothetical protein